MVTVLKLAKGKVAPVQYWDPAAGGLDKYLD